MKNKGSEERKQGLLSRLRSQMRDRYRLVIMDEATLAEKASFVLSPLNVFVFSVAVSLFLIVSVTYLIAFTSLREYIPGYADVKVRRSLIKLASRTDSLEKSLVLKEQYLVNIAGILGNKEPQQNKQRPQPDSTVHYQKVEDKRSAEDSLLRAEIEAEQKASLSSAGSSSDLRSLLFFPPVKGITTSKFKSRPDHLGIDIVARKNEAIKSTLDGTIVFSGWTLNEGYVVQIQHDGDIISVYKHNSAVLKKAGDRIKAGQPVAIIGNTGEQSTGPHLHFEIWYRGNPVDPQDFLRFQ
jgi:murein DD-endopeptidase MepM/ murein hydrolase activator NlpD